MRRTLVCAAVLAVGLVATGTPAALAEPIGGAKLTGNDVIVDPGPGATPLPDVPASAWVIADLDTGAILAAKAPHVPRPPASTLKTLTALTLIPRLDSGEVYTVTYDDIAIEGSRVGLVEEGTYTVRELLLGLMLQSGNDAASALANANGGLKKTLAQMNDEAQRLQALDTVAKTPSGLPAEGQTTSAYDLALIAREGLSRQDFLDIVGTIEVLDYPGYMPEESGGKRETFAIANQNPLLNPIDGNEPYEGAIGGKTGWTTEAGKTFVGAAERKGLRLVVTLLNFAIPTYDAAAPLLDWGFKNADKVTPVGYLVEPVAPAFDEPPAPAPADNPGAPEGQTTTDTGAQGSDAAEPGSTAVASGSTAASTASWTSGWVWGLIAAMAVGLLLIVLGVRSLRDTSRGRRARPRTPPGSDDDASLGREREPANHA